MRGGITTAKTHTHTHTKIHRAATKTISENQVQSGSRSTTVETHWEDWGDQNQIDQGRLGHTEMDRDRVQISRDRLGWTWADWDGLGQTGTD